MQFQVPQFIEAEDKIVGPLSLKQFAYLGATVGVSLFAYFILNTWLWFILSLILVGGGTALAFIKINGRPLPRVALAAVHFYWQPQKYVWQPENPTLQKDESSLASLLGDKFSLENIVRGAALKTAWTQVQVGTPASVEKARASVQRLKERYEIFHAVTGERRAAKRVDYH